MNFITFLSLMPKSRKTTETSVYGGTKPNTTSDYVLMVVVGLWIVGGVVLPFIL